MSHFRRIVLSSVGLTSLLQVSACSLWHRTAALEIEQEAVSARVTALERDLRAASLASVAVTGDHKPKALFGNHSGHNANVTVTNRGIVHNGPPGPGGSTSSVVVLVRVAAKPHETQPMPSPTTPGLAGPLPADYQTTLPLELSSVGAMRQFVVPCGFELVGMNDGAPALLDVFIKYDQEACAQR